jgi:hypothetical protein
MRRRLLIVATFCFATPLLAQSPPASSQTSASTTPRQSSAASSPAKSVGLSAYPKKQQSADQQLKDENECFASAKQQTGIDPQAPPPATIPKEQATQANAQQQKQEKAQAKAAYKKSMDNFKREFTACMEAREYSVLVQFKPRGR